MKHPVLAALAITVSSLVFSGVGIGASVPAQATELVILVTPRIVTPTKESRRKVRVNKVDAFSVKQRVVRQDGRRTYSMRMKTRHVRTLTSTRRLAR